MKIIRGCHECDHVIEELVEGDGFPSEDEEEVWFCSLTHCEITESLNNKTLHGDCPLDNEQPATSDNT